MDLQWSDHVLFFLIGVVVPAFSILGAQTQLDKINFTTSMKIRLYWSNNAYQWTMALLILGAWWWNDRPLALLGFDWPVQLPNGLTLAVLGAFLLIYVVDTVNEIRNESKRVTTRAEMKQSLSFLPQNAHEYLHFVALAFTAGICEEIIFRGFFLRYLQTIFGDTDPSFTLAILLAALLFGVVHLYQGWQSVVKIASMAIMFGYIFVHTNSLWLLIAVHTLVDLVGGAIGWSLMASKADDYGNE